LDKNECGKANEGKITSKSNYQINVAVIESDANVNVSQPSTTLNHLPLMSIESELLRKLFRIPEFMIGQTFLFSHCII